MAKTTRSAVERTKDLIDSVCMQFGCSKNLKTEVLGGVDRVKFEVLRKGRFVPCWAVIGQPVIVGGAGEMAGELFDAVNGLIRDEYNALSRR